MRSGSAATTAEARRDPSSEKVKFEDVERAIAGPLAEQDYVSTKDPNKTAAPHHGVLGNHDRLAGRRVR
jgi:hypothetical protein